MKSLLRLSALLAVAALVAWAAGAQTISLDTGPYDLSTLTSRGIGDTLEMRGTVPVGPRTPPPPEPTIPDAAVLLWQIDSRCSPAVETVTLPPLALRDCLTLQARLAAARIVKRDRVGIGSGSPCYPYTGVMRDNCLDVAARTLPGVSYGMSGRWIRGLRVGEPWEGCAAGISGNPIFVSLAEPWRVNALLSWEASNAWLWLAFDRIDLTDGPIISESTSAALTACGL